MGLQTWSTLNELVDYRAKHQRSKVNCTFLETGEGEGVSLSFEELSRHSQSLASDLLQKINPGDRVVIMMPTSLEYLIAFFACLRCGAIVVPLYRPKRNNKERRLTLIFDDCTPSLVLCRTADKEAIDVFIDSVASSALSTSLSSFAYDFDKSSAARVNRQFITAKPDDVAFLQYTSGSTGNPKGVMVTHKNLLINSLESATTMQVTEDSRPLYWLPLFHDMGLIGGVMQPLFAGCSVFLLPPEAFSKKPIRWLQAISKHNITISGAPNFAYELLAAIATDEEIAQLDLSSWALAFCGAEPIVKQVLENFYLRFHKAKLSNSAFFPCYGMAESTLFISGHLCENGLKYQSVNADTLQSGRVQLETSESSATKRHIVSCGRTFEGEQVRIVSPDSRQALDDGLIGEIWFSGPSSAKGYWNDPVKTQDIFHNTLPEHDAHFLRTGDLGYYWENELYITGRLKDVVIIRGGNHYPQDIELTVGAAHEQLDASGVAAFGVDVDGREALVVVQEVNRRDMRKLNTEDIYAAVQQAVFIEHGLNLQDLVLIRPKSLFKTTSGKLERNSAKQMYLNGEHKVIHSLLADNKAQTDAVMSSASGAINDDLDAVSTADTRPPIVKNEFIRSCKKHIHTITGLPLSEIKADKPLLSLGLNSVSITQIFAQLEDQYQREFSPALAFSFPTIAALANEFSEAEPQQRVDNERVNASADTPVDALSPEQEKQQEAEQQCKQGPQKPVARAHDGDDIAIVGMAGRLPGSENLDEYWRNIINQKDLISEVPIERWGPESTPNKTPNWGGFIEGVDEFDAAFFGISPREAGLMDPQQRLFLQTVWHALEDAGISPESLSGSATGVFVGVSTMDYFELTRVHGAKIEGHSPIGIAHSMIPNRLSYLLNLRGPSEPVDTACSSSAVAIHRAMGAIRSGDCDMAIVGGVNLMLSPTLHTGFGLAGMLSPDGRCKTFDASANGYVRGEGVGAIVLKKLSDSLADGDSIYAVIKSSAVNHGGAAGTITAPNVNAQEEVIYSAHKKSGYLSGSVGYIETHGTGTPLGDPAEVNGLKNAFENLEQGAASDVTQNLAPQQGHTASVVALVPDKPSAAKIALSSVKTNIGHLEAAAGIAGVMKVALALHHRKIPASIHCQTLNPLIDLGGSPFEVANNTRDWVDPKSTAGEPLLRRAGISSFGFGGVNTHLVLEEFNDVRSAPELAPDTPIIVILSAKTQTQLSRQVMLLLAHLKTQEWNRPELVSLAYTLQVGRSAMNARLGVIVNDVSELVARLSEYTAADEFEKQALTHVYVADASANNAATLFLDFSDDEANQLCAFWLEQRNHQRLVQAWCHGLNVGWQTFYMGASPSKIRLPRYPFARNSHWFSTQVSPACQPIIQNEYTQSPAVNCLPPSTGVVDSGDGGTSDQITSTYISTLNEKAFYLNDHRVADSATLPAMMHVELIASAIRQSQLVDWQPDSFMHFKDVCWRLPLLVSNKLDIKLVFEHQPSPGQYAVSLTSSDCRRVFSTGQVAVSQAHVASEPVDIQSLYAQATTSVECESFYQKLQRMGLGYGAGHRSVVALNVGPGLAVSKLCLPKALSQHKEAPVADSGQWHFHPSLMDGALQTLMALMPDKAVQGQLMLPAKVAEIKIHRPWSPTMWCVAKPSSILTKQEGNRHRGQKSHRHNKMSNLFDLQVFDQQGLLAVEMLGFVASEVKGKLRQNKHERVQQSDTTKPPLHILRATWLPEQAGRSSAEPRESAPRKLRQRGVFLGHTAAPFEALMSEFSQSEHIHLDTSYSEEALAEALRKLDYTPEHDHLIWSSINGGFNDITEPDSRSPASLFFRFIKALNVVCEAQSNVRLSVITDDAHAVLESGTVNPDSSSVIGLLGCAWKEYPRWVVDAFDVENAHHHTQLGDKAHTKELMSRLASCVKSSDTVNVHRHGQWYTRTLMSVELPTSHAATSIKKNGVYVVIGGAGGLGSAWTEHTLQQHDCQVIWVGRRKLDSDIEDKINTIASRARAPHYYSGDATDQAALMSVREKIMAEFGRIDGVIHSVITLDDRRIGDMSQHAFVSVLKAKRASSLVTAKVFASDELSFLTFFSSINSYAKTAGQSNYVAGCCFQDGLSRVLQQRWKHTQVSTINWGFWGNSGHVATPLHRQNMRRLGVGSIEPAEGFKVLDAMSANAINELAVVCALDGRVLDSLNVDNNKNLVFLPGRKLNAVG